MAGFRGVEGGRGSGEGIATRWLLFSEDPCAGEHTLGWDVCFYEHEQWTMAGGLGPSSAVALVVIPVLMLVLMLQKMK